MDDYEKEFDEKLKIEIAKFKRIRARNDKFRQVYGWIESLIDMCEELQIRIKTLENEIISIRKDMEDER